MRKGNVHIDWAISLGVFLIAIIALLVFLNPWIKPFHQENVLLDLVERRFLENTSWTVKKLPVFVEMLSNSNDDKDPFVQIAMQDWEFSDYEVTNLAGGQGDLIVTLGDTAVIDCISPACKEQRVDLLFYPEFAGADDPLLQTPYCTNGRGDDLSSPPDPNCNIELGSTEDIKGIRMQWMDSLQEYGDYAALKLRWNYPDEKGFAIYDITGGNEELIIGGMTEGDKNIFVRELRYWALGKDDADLDGDPDRTPITISFRAW